MRFLVSAPAPTPNLISNGSESEGIEFEIIKFVIVVHLSEDPTHLIGGY